MSQPQNQPTSPQSSRPDAGESLPYRYTAALADAIERRWQEEWDQRGAYTVPNPGEPGFNAAKPKYYVLDMFPYPSGAGLHVGHPEGYTATDIISRFKRMNGFNVLHPMGWDAFGLPAEQYAIQTGIHPAKTTRGSIDNFRRQLKRFGFCYDWSREFGTIDDDYYEWTQWIFLRLYNAWFDPAQNKARHIDELVADAASGSVATPRPWAEMSNPERDAFIDDHRLAYLNQQVVNWCPKLGTVLANDEVIDGRSERGGYPVLRKPLKQWVFRITAFADRLADQLDQLDWPESTKTMQREWIGRSEGAEIDFTIAGSDATIRVFTTRPDTLFGATYMVVAPEHEVCARLMRGELGVDAAATDALKKYVAWASSRSDVERQESKEKTGVFTGLHAINPVTGAQIPVWTADYVLTGYGTGAIMAVPAGDERDWEFAKKFNLPIIPVVAPAAGVHVEPDACFSGEGIAINSSNNDISLDGMTTAEAKATIIAWLESTGRGTRKVNYRLRDWVFSRQRYWGEPFPIVYDAAGKAYPLVDSALPVKLPDLADYAPVESDDPQPLLAKATAWVNTTAGAAGVDPKLLAPNTPVRRETNTMPGSAGSSWYAIRYCDPRNNTRFASREAESYWMGGSTGGVDFYIGGSEHAVGHLLYARFWQNVLFDLGEVSTPEPFKKLFHQGLITSFAYQRPDKTLVPNDQVREEGEGPDGKPRYVEIATGQTLTPIVAKMSKSLKNVVNPDDVIAEFGADTFRLYEMYMGPLEASKPWNPRDIAGCFRFLQRLWRLVVDEATGDLKLAPSADRKAEQLLHRATAKVAGDIERLAFNTAIAALMELVNALTPAGGAGGAAVLTREQAERLALILSPLAPHMAEELWHKLEKNVDGDALIVNAAWPAVDPALLRDSEIEIPIQIQGKVRARITIPADAKPDQIEKLALADPKVQESIAGKPVKKVIVVPGKMVNIVI
jgi:leucyl-tRNA synthetase